MQSPSASPWVVALYIIPVHQHLGFQVWLVRCLLFASPCDVHNCFFELYSRQFLLTPQTTIAQANPGKSDNQEFPPGFDRYLHASIRSYNDPAERAAAIKDQVYNAHNMDELKHGMALQASEFLQQQIR